jgi:two-component system chemotaxis response regulator CheY
MSPSSRFSSPRTADRRAGLATRWNPRRDLASLWIFFAEAADDRAGRSAVPIFNVSPMKTILAVDDSASVRHMVKITLGAAGYQVIEASDGRDGLTQAKANAVAMIVTDLNMPNMNGLEFIREVRKLPPYRGVPIVFLTTESDDGMKQQAKAAGATGWITKPFRQEQLLAAAKKFLG